GGDPRRTRDFDAAQPARAAEPGRALRAIRGLAPSPRGTAERVGNGLLAPPALGVELDPQVLGRELAPERAQDEVQRARVAVLERGAREHAVDHRADVAARGGAAGDLVGQDVVQGRLEELAALARERLAAALVLAE